MLAAIAQIAAALATGDGPTEVLGGVLARVSDTVAAAGVSLWLTDELYLKCRARVGVAPPPVSVVKSHLAAPGRTTSDLILVRLDAGHHPLGALVLIPTVPLAPEQRAFLSTVADHLART